MNDLASLFPPHKAGLTLEHNPHHAYHDSVKKWVDDLNSYAKGCVEWASDEERDKAMADDELWVLQWYPDTPIGFHRLMARDLGVLLEAARSWKGGK